MREHAVLDGCFDLQVGVRDLLVSVGELSPGELSGGGDEETVRVVSQRLDDCLALFDRLEAARGRPARYRRFLEGGIAGGGSCAY